MKRSDDMTIMHKSRQQYRKRTKGLLLESAFAAPQIVGMTKIFNPRTVSKTRVCDI